MPLRIPMPDCLSFFLMIGNDLSELAAHIASSVRDHCAEPDRFSVNCISLVDEEFDLDEDTAIERDLYYSCPSPMETSLNETALWVVRDKLQKTMNRTEGIPKFRYQFNRIRFVIVADTAGEYELSTLDSLRQALIDEMNADGKSATVLLCLTAENTKAAEQREWLMTEEGKLREEIDRFEKVLLLTPHNMKGIITLSTRRDMQDVAFPALIMMMNGHVLTEADRLYTAAYKKQGGTSNDILELRRHIASSALETYFSSPDALSRQEILTILSTNRIRLDGQGKTLEEKAMECAGRYVPELRHLVLTADLEDRDFNPVPHIMEFDDMNRDRMAEIGNWPEEWLDEVKGKILKQIHPDAIWNALDENGNDNLASEILQSWSDLMTRVTGEDIQTREALERRLTASCPTPKKGFLQSVRDYNMLWLNAATGVYADICKERIAYRILTCLQRGMKPLRAFLKEAIDRRQKVLKAYQMENDKLRVLTDMIPAAARELKESYTRTGLIEKLPTYIQHRSKLNTDEGRPYWTSLYHEFLDKGTQTSSFSEAFIKGTDSIGLRKKTEPLGEDVYAMIPSYPDELGAMKLPVKSFLLNKAVADMIQDNIQDSQVYEVPGDLLEHVSLFPMGTDLETMTRLTLFRKMPGAHPGRNRGNGPTALNGRQRTKQQAPLKADTNLNPWNIQIIETGTGQMLCWDYPSDHGDAVIRFNGRVINSGYRYIDYVNSGMGLLLRESDLASGTLRIEIECGSERQQYQTEYQKPGEPVQIEPGKTKVRCNSGEEFTHNQASDDRYENRCLVFADDPQRWRIPFFPFGIDERGMINPLWCAKEARLELEDI